MPPGASCASLPVQDENGQLMLSRRRILFGQAWDRVAQLYADDAVVEVCLGPSLLTPTTASTSTTTTLATLPHLYSHAARPRAHQRTAAPSLVCGIPRLRPPLGVCTSCVHRCAG
jgi:hypothetical protein